MKNKKSLVLMLVAVLLLIAAGVTLIFSLRAENNTQNDQLLAETIKNGNGLPVKVEKITEYPGVYISLFGAGEYSLSPSACMDSSFRGSKDAYNKSLVPHVACTNGFMQSGNFIEKIQHDTTSIEEINKMLIAVQSTLDKLNKTQSIDGLSINVIPGGLDTTPSIPYAENIAMQCVRKKIGNGYEQSPVVAVGTKATIYSLLFDSAPPSLIAELAAMRLSNADINAKIEPKLASDETKLTTGENYSLAKTALSIHSALSGKHIGVTDEILNREYRNLVRSKVPISFQASLARDKNGSTINCNSSVSGAVKLLASGFGLKGDYFRVNLKIDGLTYTKVCIPDASLLTLIKEDMEKHIARLERVKASHVARKSRLETQLKALEDKNYNCSNL